MNFIIGRFIFRFSAYPDPRADSPETGRPDSNRSVCDASKSPLCYIPRKPLWNRSEGAFVIVVVAAVAAVAAVLATSLSRERLLILDKVLEDSWQQT